MPGAAKLRLASRVRLFESLLAALWAFRNIVYLLFYFLFLLQRVEIL